MADYTKAELHERLNATREDREAWRDLAQKRKAKIEELQDQVDGYRRAHLEDQRSIAEAYGWINCQKGLTPNGGHWSLPSDGEDLDFNRAMGGLPR